MSNWPGFLTFSTPYSAPFVHRSFCHCDPTWNVKGVPTCCALDGFDQDYPFTRSMKSQHKTRTEGLFNVSAVPQLFSSWGRFPVGANQCCSPVPVAGCHSTLAVHLHPHFAFPYTAVWRISWKWCYFVFWKACSTQCGRQLPVILYLTII